MTEATYAFVVYFGMAWLLIGLATVAAMAITDVQRLARGEEQRQRFSAGSRSGARGR